MLETTMKQIKEEGRDKGREEGIFKVAIDMIKKGMDDSIIKETTGLKS